MDVRIEPSWKEALKSEFGAEYFLNLTAFVRQEYTDGTVYPRKEDIFRAFELTSFSEVSVVILGQDPYHGEEQAMGLSFSVTEGTKLPPSLRNIYKELESDVGSVPRSGDLSAWAKQGVLLLNATLTVRAHTPGSHQSKGWETFTDAAISTLSKERENVVFILWGNYAKAKRELIDPNKHLIIESAHPSPLSASRGFFGSKPFSRANEYLSLHKKKPIKWA
ncbi:uracil-DNA glycosylase [Patescibacteria group bacterium]|nr:uracil-DNA glycosylase [Patescibacteria group bacterium]